MSQVLILKHQISPAINDFCSDLLREEIIYASVALLDNKTLYSAWSHKNWKENYLSLALYLHDPCYQAASRVSSIPFFWETVPKNTKKAARIIEARTEMTGATSGFTVGFRKNSKILFVTMGAQLESLEFMTTINTLVIPRLDTQTI